MKNIFQKITLGGMPYNSLLRRKSSIPLNNNQTINAQRNHFPLDSPCGITIHKFQGDTFDEIVYATKLILNNECTSLCLGAHISRDYSLYQKVIVANISMAVKIPRQFQIYNVNLEDFLLINLKMILKSWSILFLTKEDYQFSQSITTVS